MAHYAFLDENNVVTEVIVGRDENEIVDGITDWEAHYGEFRGQVCKRTSYSTRAGVHYDDSTGEPSADQSKSYRGNYAGVGFTYDEALDAFIPPQPFPSWTLDEAEFSWSPPTPYPDGDEPYVSYIWDEDAGNWVASQP